MYTQFCMYIYMYMYVYMYTVLFKYYGTVGFHPNWICIHVVLFQLLNQFLWKRE